MKKKTNFNFFAKNKIGCDWKWQKQFVDVTKTILHNFDWYGVIIKNSQRLAKTLDSAHTQQIENSRYT